MNLAGAHAAHRGWAPAPPAPPPPVWLRGRARWGVGCASPLTSDERCDYSDLMKRASLGVRQAKAKFSEVVRRAQAGQEVTITDRGRPVARVVPIPAEGRPLPQRLQELESRGWIEPMPPRGDSRLPKPVRLRAPGLAQRILQEHRDAGS